MSEVNYAQVETDQSKALNRLGQSSIADLEARHLELEQQMKETLEKPESEEKTQRLNILKADFKQIRESIKAEQEDLAVAVGGLNVLFEQMGEDYADLEKPSADELKLIRGADAILAAAKQQLVDAQGAWFFKGTKIAEAETAIANAKTSLTRTKTQVKQMARKRLMSASMEDSLQNFMLKVDQTKNIMASRLKEIVAQVAAVSTRKQEAFKIKEAAAKSLEQLDTQLNQLEGDLQTAEQDFESLENGTQEYVDAEKTISDLRRDTEALRGERNESLVLYQSKERFAAELEVHERSQMKLRDNHRAWIKVLESDTEERVVTFRSRLEAMKAVADQNVAQELTELGHEIDHSNTEYMARVGAGSDNHRMDMVEKHSERVINLEQIKAHQAEAHAAIRQREGKHLEELKQKWGIDTMESSFFHYVDENPQGEEAMSSDEPVATTGGMF